MLPPEFVTGCQWFLDALPNYVETTPRIVLTVYVEDVEVTALADTGATQCVIGWDIGEQLLELASERNPQLRALGGNVHEGTVFPVLVTFRADEGEPVAVHSTAWASETFYGPSLIGYGGLLEKVRFAIDPASNRFYFGN